jgi:hypothetical protein
MTVSVNIERMLAILQPLRSIAWTKHLIPISVTVAVVYNIPKFFELEIVGRGFFRNNSLPNMPNIILS